ncbi:acid-sensing ion channel 1C-like [Hydractinia symbiolongicarpus]|uniref:acid-sensing ion channel 1C-like n=1 Tax=Hydractinia symbiolongicarpus TaxID=13093 RepID=UPI00254AE631|nr:acid-sensing ion channel 1C-like [Hydractinia symbiolongicarpus]XP_057307361.1 acid-sensing ion channel 1C-like [Hydractinia symbiolongicarpus]XP_057307362.1 acid-sensing ion channel 1C-like [Hydractinia symbiolongicarpus]
MLNFQDIAKITVEAIHEKKEEERSHSRNSGSGEELPKTITEKRKEKIKEHIDDFIENSSLHGLSYIFDKRHSVRRIIWFVITVAAFGYSMQKVYESTVNFLDYPFNTARMRQYVDEIEFPAVSFCNLNDMRMSVLNGTMVDEAILDHSKAKNVTAEVYRNVTRGAAHLLEEMLVDCTFNGMKCSHENFTFFYWKQGDQCFTFNSGQKGHPVLSVTGTGIERSLTMTINLQHYDYYRDRLISGIHLLLHGQDETPVRIRGPMISPGYTTYIQVEKKQIINLESPYKTHCGSLNLKYFKSYSRNTCWLEQLTDYVNESCGCKDFFMPGEIPICSFQVAISCMWPKWEEFDTEKLYNCPLPCEIHTYYGHSKSRALFPSKNQAPKLADLVRNDTHMKDVKGIDDLQFLRDNFLRIVIFYDDLSYEKLEQQPSYDMLVWLGDIGGQIGLFIGAGVMSYFEFVDCLLLVIFARFAQSFKTKPIVV